MGLMLYLISQFSNKCIRNFYKITKSKDNLSRWGGRGSQRRILLRSRYVEFRQLSVQMNAQILNIAKFI